MYRSYLFCILSYAFVYSTTSFANIGLLCSFPANFPLEYCLFRYTTIYPFSSTTLVVLQIVLSSSSQCSLFVRYVNLSISYPLVSLSLLLPALAEESPELSSLLLGSSFPLLLSSSEKLPSDASSDDESMLLIFLFLCDIFDFFPLDSKFEVEEVLTLFLLILELVCPRLWLLLSMIYQLIILYFSSF